jgi:hypothetical protein
MSYFPFKMLTMACEPLIFIEKIFRIIRRAQNMNRTKRIVALSGVSMATQRSWRLRNEKVEYGQISADTHGGDDRLIQHTRFIPYIFRAFIRTPKLNKIVGNSKNNYRDKKKELYFPSHYILYNNTLLLNVQFIPYRPIDAQILPNRLFN